MLAPAKVKFSPGCLMCWIGVKHRDWGAEPAPSCSLEHGRLSRHSQRMQFGIPMAVVEQELLAAGLGVPQ